MPLSEKLQHYADGSLSLRPPHQSTPHNNSDLFSPHDPFLARLNEALETRLQDLDLCSGNLHRVVPTSRATLHRKLSQTLGLSASAYLNKYRVYRSLDYLPRAEYSITDIALLVGMNCSAYTRAFKNFLGQTPNKFRYLKHYSVSTNNTVQDFEQLRQ